jgi:uncharacterized protein
MQKLLSKKTWSPYIVGLMIGVLLTGSVLFFQKGLGASIIFSIQGKSIIDLFSGTIPTLLSFHWWYLMVFIGLLLGGFTSAYLSSSTSPSFVPKLWEKYHGKSKKKRAFFAFLGGFLLIIGARIAGGCTSGHVITGGGQLATSGFLFMVALFAGGVTTAFLFYKK